MLLDEEVATGVEQAASLKKVLYASAMEIRMQPCK